MCYHQFNILNLTINITLDCNMRCSYCYVFSDELKSKDRQARLSLNDIDSIMRDYAYLNHTLGNKICDITWHGGEPLIVGKEEFLRIVRLQEKIYKETNIFIRNRVQTNATLIDDGWCKFFKKYKFAIGVSIDGPKMLYDRNRYYKGKKSAYCDVLVGIENLKKHSIPYGILVVVNEDTYKYVDEIYAFFSTIGVGTVDFIPSYLPVDNIYNIDSVHWGDFLCALFKKWTNNPMFSIPYFEDIIEKIISISRNEDSSNYIYLCELTDICGENLSITPNMNLYYCECLIGMSEYLIGNVSEYSLAELTSSEKFFKTLKEMNNVSDRCIVCRHFKICRAGCLKHRIGHAENYDYFCRGKMMIFDCILNFLKVREEI